MKISEAIKQLDDILKNEGDLDLRISYEEFGWDVEEITTGGKSVVDEDGFEDISDEDYCWIRIGA